MIHLKTNYSDLVQGWLDDDTDSKGESKQKEFAHTALREVANMWQIPYMKTQVDGFFEVNGRKVKSEEIKRAKLVDEQGGELVLGEKMTEKLQDAYSLVRLVNPNVDGVNINDWCRKVIEERILTKKAEQTGQDLLKEEKMLYGEEPDGGEKEDGK